MEGIKLSPEQRLSTLVRSASDVRHVNQLCLPLGNRADANAIRARLQEAVSANEILRTSIVCVPGLKEPLQVLSDTPALAFGTYEAADSGGRDDLLTTLCAGIDVSKVGWRADVLQGTETAELVLTAHSQILDAPSLLRLADLALGRTPIADDAEAFQFADISDWQNELLEQADAEGQADRWHAWLTEFMESPDPDIGVAPSQESCWTTARTRTIGVDRCAFAGRADQPLSSCLAAWACVIARSSNTNDVRLSLQHPGRHHESLEATLGPLQRELPCVLRVDTDADLPAQIESLESQLDERRALIDYLPVTAPARSHTVSPLFGFAGLDCGSTAIDDVRCAPVHAAVVLRAVATRAEVLLTVEYDASACPDSFADLLLERIRSYLCRWLEKPSTSSRDLPLVSEPESRRIRGELRGDPLPTAGATVVDDVLRQAARNGSETAVVCGATRLSYGQLCSRAATIAKALHELGLPAGNVVVCGERSAGFVAAILGAGAAGFTYVPVDSGYPEERVRFIIEDAGAVCVLRDASCTVRVDGGLPVLDFDHAGLLAGTVASTDSPLENRAKPADPAYLIYTSGSTGQPKGVVISHANLLLSTAARNIEYERQPVAYLMPSSFAFDSSVAGIYWTLTCGGKLVIPAPAEAADAQVLGALVAEHRVTHTLMLPSLYDAVLKTTAPADLRSLNTVIVAGEECPPDIPARHFAALPDAGLFNEYGPTEATVWCTVCRISPEHGSGRLPIGRPIAGTTLHILDTSMNPVPVGSAGELYVESSSVSEGYWRRHDLTAERFLPAPHAATDGLRMYRTGDLVRLNTAGQVEFLGRVDRQVKIRGYRIELEEVESAMRKVPGVSQAAVTVQESDGGKELAGYYTCDDGGIEAEALVSALRVGLPAHFVPRTVVQLVAMPLMPNGKIDFRALPSATVLAGDDDAGYEEPRNAAEKKLQRIFQDVLERERVGIRENFFDIGGHSILATIAVARMREAFGVPIAIRTLFDQPTIAGLNEGLFGPIEDPAPAAATPEAIEPQAAIPARSDRTSGRLSPMQQALWYLCQLDTSRGAYNLQCGFTLAGNPDLATLKEAIDIVVNSHPVLRSDFAAGDDGQPFARIHERVAVPFETIDLRQTGQSRREYLDQVAVAPVPTDRAPLLRVSLARCADDEHLLIFVFHHIVVEGWSVTTVLRETGQVYADLVAGKHASLPIEAIDYWDWNEYEAGRLSDEALAPQLSYWQARLAGRKPHLELAPRKAGGSSRGGMTGTRLSAGLVQRLERVAKDRGATLFILLLGAYQVLLHRYTGETDIRVGVPMNTRTRPELDRTAGLFINTLVMRGETDPALTFEDFLGVLQNDVLDAFSNMDAPLEAVARSVNEAAAGQADRDLFQAMFALQNAPSMSLDLTGVETTMLEHDELHSGAGKVELSLVVEPGTDGYRAWVEFDGRAFDEERAGRFLRHFDRLLHSIAERPHEELRRLDILPDDERRTLLETFNATTRDYDPRAAVERVWEQVETQPDRVAVVDAGVPVTYRELGTGAKKVVHAILAAGCPAGGVVAVCLRRSPALIETLVGIHLAGGCYVPIDPEYPDERIEHIVNDSGAILLITDTPVRFADMALDAAVVDSSAVRGGSPAESGSFRLPSGDDLAYIVYTSGSTGVPKGVRIAQRGLSNLVAWEERTFGVTAADRGTMLAGLGFDATVWEVWPCLAVGAELHLVEDGIRANPAAVYEWLAKSGITLTFLPTPLAELVLDLPPPPGIALRYLFTGGDMLHARQWPELPFPVVNHYGPSENTVIATAGAVNTQLPPDVPPDIGKPIDNTRAYILDDALQPVPVGVVGELCLAGPAVSCGYANEEQRSAGRFVANPLADGAWARLYRTGDRARFNVDGTIEFLGRIDQQVKVRGFRIELGDIEATLNRHPAVANAVAAVWNVNRDDQRIAAYIVPEPGHAGVDAMTLRKFASKRLPSYMVPTYFTSLDALPLTQNGKVDRKALPSPVAETGSKVQDPPATATEVAIAETWQRILGAETMDRNANFFEVGGNSISAMKVVSEIYARLGVQVPLRAIVMDSLSQVAAWCDEKAPAAAAPGRRAGGLQKLFTRVFGGNA